LPSATSSRHERPDRCGARRLERQAGLLDVLVPQRFECLAVERQQVLALELVVHPALADREGPAHAAAQVAVDELLVLDEADARARRRVLDAFGLAREVPDQLARQAVHERRAAGVHLGGDVAVDRRHLGEVGARGREVLGDRHEPRENRLLALLERRERARHEQEQAAERRLGIHRRVVRVTLDLLEVGAHRRDLGAHHRVVHALVGRQVLPRHQRHQALVEVAQPGAALAEAVRRVVGKKCVVVVDSRHRRRDGIVAQRDLDEFFTQRAELPDILGHGAPVTREGLRRFARGWVCRRGTGEGLRRFGRRLADSRDVRRLISPGTGHDVELHALALGQRLEPVGLDGREVNEELLARVIPDEAEALGLIEPLHDTLHPPRGALPRAIAGAGRGA
jgi:hypothetical protein